MAPCDIEFSSKHPYNVPCIFVPNEYKYIVCLGCVEGEKILYCNGATEYRYKICPEHQKAFDTGTLYDRDLLIWIRESLLNGTLKRPKPSGPPKLPPGLKRSPMELQRAKEIDQIKAWWPESGPNKDWHLYELSNEEKELLKHKKHAEGVWPRPAREVCSHIDDCNYGVCPAYITATHEEIATFNYCRLQDRADVYWDGCKFCDREHLDWPYTLDREGKDVVRKDPVTHHPLPNAHCSECVAAINLATEEVSVPDGLKMMFFKRCNGEFINALGLVLKAPRTLSATSLKEYKRPNPDFRYMALKCREEMVTMGSITAENFTRFCWFKNKNFADDAAEGKGRRDTEEREAKAKKLAEAAEPLGELDEAFANLIKLG